MESTRVTGSSQKRDVNNFGTTCKWKPPAENVWCKNNKLKSESKHTDGQTMRQSCTSTYNNIHSCDQSFDPIRENEWRNWICFIIFSNINHAVSQFIYYTQSLCMLWGIVARCCYVCCQLYVLQRRKTPMFEGALHLWFMVKTAPFFFFIQYNITFWALLCKWTLRKNSGCDNFQEKKKERNKTQSRHRQTRQFNNVIHPNGIDTPISGNQKRKREEKNNVSVSVPDSLSLSRGAGF